MLRTIIRIKRHISCFGGFQLLIGERYPVLFEGESTGMVKQKLFMVASNVKAKTIKGHLPIAVYEHECDIVAKLTK